MNETSKRLRELGARRHPDGWKIPIKSLAPVTLTRQEVEWNRKGGRPLGKNAEEALETVQTIWGSEKTEDELRSEAAALMGRKGGSVSSPKKTEAVRENSKKGGRVRKSPRGFGEGFLRTGKGFYCQDCGKWQLWKNESRYSTGAEVRTVCPECYASHLSE